jgi:peroxiredoxin
MSARIAGFRLAVTAASVFALSALSAAVHHLSLRAPLQPANIRRIAPGFSLQENSGRTITLNEYRGKVVLINFWANWCHGCKQEIPWFMEFAGKYQARGFVVIGISMDDEGWKAVRPFLAKKKLNYSIVIGNESLAKQYGLDSMPLSILVDRNGKIADSNSGVVDKNSWEKEIQELLLEEPGLAAR